jgi:hypothetical protein
LFPVNLLCEVIGVSRSYYYIYVSGQSHKSAKGKEDTVKLIVETSLGHKRRYGSRQLVKALHQEGHRVSRHPAGKILTPYDIIQPRSFGPSTINSGHTLDFSPNLLIREGLPIGPNQVGISHIT